MSRRANCLHVTLDGVRIPDYRAKTDLTLDEAVLAAQITMIGTDYQDRAVIQWAHEIEEEGAAS
jgi:hypothetical protein